MEDLKPSAGFAGSGCMSRCGGGTLGRLLSVQKDEERSWTLRVGCRHGPSTFFGGHLEFQGLDVVSVYRVPRIGAERFYITHQVSWHTFFEEVWADLPTHTNHLLAR